MDDTEWMTEPIAIIGMSCRFAGGASSPEKLWELLTSGRTGWSPIPEERFHLEGVYHPNNERISTGAHFLDDDVACFDAAFFNYSAEMAQVLDPQFRQQLESAYEAFENAGLRLDGPDGPTGRPGLAGSRTSVYAGTFTHDYHEALVRDEDQLPRFNVVGTWSAMAANRLSHFFDLRGPSMTLDTGCSTTLVALHQAMQSLRQRESDVSVVSGVNLMLGADAFKSIGSVGMLSPDGRCFAFDERANGYGRGEGVATIVLKRLSDALADGDPVRAVVRETAVNQDGKTGTITTPSGAAQANLMRECYVRAGLDPRGTQYFEAHGTGTQAGDPTEAEAVAGVFAPGRIGKADAALRIGSIKPNVGHTEAASGLAAIVKGVLCLEKGLIPPSANFETPNQKLRLDDWRLKVVTATEPWPSSLEPGGPRRLSVNNFGYGGTNAHVVMESADYWVDLGVVGETNGHGAHDEAKARPTNSTKILLLSARDENGCRARVANLKDYLQAKKRSLNKTAAAALLSDLAYTLAERRTLFPWVAAHQVTLGVGENGESLNDVIAALDSPRFQPSRRPSQAQRPRIGMVFTGQGAQWFAMGRELYATYPVFRSAIDEAEEVLRDVGADWRLTSELLERDAATTRVGSTALSIPVCVALQIALVRLLAAWGIKPAAVASHSSGEIAAAYAAGALTLRQALATAYHRAALAAAGTTAGPRTMGAMAALGVGVADAQTYLDGYRDRGTAVVACINSPQSVTISGDAAAVQAVVDGCTADGIFARRLKVEQAYHSHHMDVLAEPYRARLREELATTVGAGDSDTIDLVFSSAVTGTRIGSKQALREPGHWVDSLVRPVQFVDALGNLVQDGAVDVLLEVGPHTALGGPIREILADAAFADSGELPYWGCLVRYENAADTMRAAAIGLLRAGVSVDLGAINFPGEEAQSERRVLTDLPAYPWNHSKRHWREPRLSRAIRARSQPPHDLLGMRVPGTAPDAAEWRRPTRAAETPWLRDHAVQGSIVFPGAGYLCLALEAARQLESTETRVSGFRFRDIAFLAALVVPDDSSEAVEIRTRLQPADARELGAKGWWRFEVSTVTLDSRWTRHAQGFVTVERAEGVGADQVAPLSAYTRRRDARDMFAEMRAGGLVHGPLFQNTDSIVQDGRAPRAQCDISVRYAADADTDALQAAARSVLHPITLDAVIVSFFAAASGPVGGSPKLPRAIDDLWVSSAIGGDDGHRLRCDTTLRYDNPRSGCADVHVTDGETGAPVLAIRGLTCVALRGSADVADGKESTQVCSTVAWAPDLALQKRLRPQLQTDPSQSLVERLLANTPAAKTADSALFGQVAALLRSLAHKNPTARVLQVGTGTGSASAAITRRLLAAIGSPRTPSVAGWHIAERSADALDAVRADLTDQGDLGGWTDRLVFSLLDLESENEGPAEYDVVMACGASIAAHVTNALANTRRLLRPGGSLLLAAPPHDQAKDVDRLLRDAGFDGVDLAFPVDGVILATVPPAAAAPLLGRGDRFAIVTASDDEPTAASALADSLVQRIAAITGSRPARLALDTADGLDRFASKVCMFVDAPDEPLRMAPDDSIVFDGLRAMVTQCSGLLWLSAGGVIDSSVAAQPLADPEQALCQGFLRVLRSEYVGRRYVLLDLPAQWEARKADRDDMAAATLAVAAQAFGVADADEDGPVELEYALRDGVLLIPRIVKDAALDDMIASPAGPSATADANRPLEPFFQDGRPLRLTVGIPGQLDTLSYADDDAAENGLPPDMVEIVPHAFGLGTRDALAAMGQLRDGASFATTGLELAGEVARVGAYVQGTLAVGDRVLALAAAGSSFASRVRVPWNGVVPAPDRLSFAEAASLPLVLLAAFAALVDTAHLAKGQSLLVHLGEGRTDGVAEAAILLAQHHLGITDIYATVDTPAQRDEVAHQHGIPANRIFVRDDDSTTALVSAIRRATGGIDVVLSSVPPGPLLQASLDVVAPLGHVLDVRLDSSGDADTDTDNSLLALASIRRGGVSLTSLDAPALLRRCHGPHMHHVLQQVVALVDQQTLPQLPAIAVHPLRDVQAAFRRILAGDAGKEKVVLSAAPGEAVAVVPRPPLPPLHLRADASYLVVGGIGGIGRSIAHWLVAHGARNLILLSRSAGTLDEPAQQHTDGARFVRELREAVQPRGGHIVLFSGDVALAADLVLMLRRCRDAGLPPVRGVIQAAMLLRDSVFEHMSLADWYAGLRPKLQGTFNLHQEFHAPGSLDFFVMLSSISGVLGIASQTNYAAGGSYEDALAHWRRARGLPAVALDLGPIGDVGYVAETARVADRLRRSADHHMLDEALVLRALHTAISGGNSAPPPPQIILGLNSGPGDHWDPAGSSQLGRDARYATLCPRANDSDSQAGNEGTDSLALPAQLSLAVSRDDAARLVGAAIALKLADLFLLDVAEIDLAQSPARYGVDSLVAVELRNMLALHAAADISIFNILQSPSLSALAADVAVKSQHVKAAA